MNFDEAGMHKICSPRKVRVSLMEDLSRSSACPHTTAHWLSACAKHPSSRLRAAHALGHPRGAPACGDAVRFGRSRTTHWAGRFVSLEVHTASVLTETLDFIHTNQPEIQAHASAPALKRRLRRQRFLRDAAVVDQFGRLACLRCAGLLHTNANLKKKE